VFYQRLVKISMFKLNVKHTFGIFLEEPLSKIIGKADQIESGPGTT
jgi:hypothetical protein